MIVLRWLHCVLEPSKAKVMETAAAYAGKVANVRPFGPPAAMRPLRVTPRYQHGSVGHPLARDHGWRPKEPNEELLGRQLAAPVVDL